MIFDTEEIKTITLNFQFSIVNLYGFINIYIFAELYPFFNKNSEFSINITLMHGNNNI